jgi:uncharacterized protein involved in tolerance to divalent cations
MIQILLNNKKKEVIYSREVICGCLSLVHGLHFLYWRNGNVKSSIEVKQILKVSGRNLK